MSYILDALKKSEKERKRGRVPDVLTIQETIPRETKKRSFWPYLIVAALLLNATVIILWFSPWDSKRQKVVIHSPNTIETKTIAESNKQNQLAQVKHDLQKKGMDQPVQKVETKRPDKVMPVIPKQDTVIAEVPSEKKPENHPAPIRNKIYNMSELPQSIQQNLPAFNISVFLYSDDPASRMVRVNGQMIKEGQYLANGLKLEEIVSNGLIFNYQDFRFRIGLK